jgi:selenide,water dikinase
MIKLTQTVKKGGCAAKVPAMILKEILSGVKFPPKIQGVLVDGNNFDDAAIFKIDENLSLVQTLDFFTPIVDSPYEFGAIAAANALSDVYAMGGRPKTCMAILAAPMATMEAHVIQEVLQGACDVMVEAKASLVGGHSIDDDNLKFGLSVTGLVATNQVWSNEGSQVGDVLILTKPLGTGTICAGIKKEIYSATDAEEALSSMKRLNNVIDYLSADELAQIHGATDVTGFGLAGHGYQVAKASNVSFKISHKDLPLFDLTLSSLNASNLTKAHRSNAEYTQNSIKFQNINEIEKQIYFDPQTSGGLLLSVSAKYAADILMKLKSAFPKTSIIGIVEKRSEFYLYVE